MFEGLVPAGAIGHAADQAADLVDDLGMENPQRGMRIGMLRLQLQSPFQTAPHLGR